ncbi:DUF4381 domain-containing protein [Paraburkholderia caffeinilytica]|uniref:DUF4381 domain-containing protein n=1 Tax=Paraburkholderia caffeinilytica TaxID=1761016 RepID=UPI0038BE0280
MSAPAVSALAPPDTSGQLQPLLELPLPQAVSYAPQTIGWVFAGFLLLVLLAVASWLVWRQRRQQRYRRVALAELASIEASLVAMQTDSAQRASALAAIPRLIKRTSLAVAPREQVAALTGDAWLAFLQRTHGRFDARSEALLALASYAPADQVAAISADEAATLISHTRDWIEHHHVEV